jgi:hypothetical protein
VYTYMGGTHVHLHPCSWQSPYCWF